MTRLHTDTSRGRRARLPAREPDRPRRVPRHGLGRPGHRRHRDRLGPAGPAERARRRPRRPDRGRPAGAPDPPGAAVRPRRRVSDTTRLDLELVRRGLARSRGHARALIDAGDVSIDGKPAAKPATPVGHGDAHRGARGGAALGEPRGIQARGRPGGLRARRDSRWRASAASTSARRPAGSPRCCCTTAPRTWSRSTSGTASWCPSWPHDPRVTDRSRTTVRGLAARRHRGSRSTCSSPT